MSKNLHSSFQSTYKGETSGAVKQYLMLSPPPVILPPHLCLSLSNKCIKISNQDEPIDSISEKVGFSICANVPQNLGKKVRRKLTCRCHKKDFFN